MEGLVEKNSYSQFMKVFTTNERALKAFIRSMLPSIDDAEEVLQEVSLIAWNKFEKFDTSTNFLSWVFAIAKFEVLKYRRVKARDRLVFDEEVLGLIADEVSAVFSKKEIHRNALDDCLSQLPKSKREIVLKAHTSGVKMKMIAEAIGVSPNALYKTIERIRIVIFRCVKKKLAER